MNSDFLDSEREISIETLIVLRGFTSRFRVSVPKKDGYSTYIISYDFVESHRKKLNIDACNLTISHSAKSKIGESLKLVRNMKLQSGSNHIASDFAIGDVRHVVMLGMPWRKKFKPFINYENGELIMNGNSLARKDGDNSKVQVSNLRTKKFYSLRGEFKKNFELFMVTNVETAKVDVKSELAERSAKLEIVLKHYSSVF